MPHDCLTLSETQSALFSLITGRDVGRRFAAAAAFVVSDERADADQRVAVYAFMYRARLIETLASQFPRLAKLVGEKAFADLCCVYVDDHPSRHASLRFLGAHLPKWLSRHPLFARVADLAALEWARADVFDAVDEPVLTVDAIRGWPQDRFAELPITLIEAQRRIEAGTGTAALWQRLEFEDVSPSTFAPLGSECLLIWREDVSVYHRRVDALEGRALALAATGTTLGRVCEIAAEGDADQAITRTFEWIWRWASDRLLADLKK